MSEAKSGGWSTKAYILYAIMTVVIIVNAVIMEFVDAKYYTLRWICYILISAVIIIYAIVHRDELQKKEPGSDRK